MPIIEEIEEIPENTTPPYRRGRHADARTSPLPPQPSLSNPNQKPIRSSCPRKILFVCLKWVIMTLILGLFLVFIGFAALVILHFLVTNTAVQRRRRRRRRDAQSFHNSFTRPSSAFSIQDLLPCVGYSATEQTRRDCAICLEAFKEGDLCRKLPDCTHLFHVNCVDSWLTKKPNCPVCRTRVQLDWGPSGSMNSDDEWKFWWPVGA